MSDFKSGKEQIKLQNVNKKKKINKLNYTGNALKMLKNYHTAKMQNKMCTEFNMTQITRDYKNEHHITA